MGEFRYSNEELNINKVLKMNQTQSEELSNDPALHETRAAADQAIADSLALLESLGKPVNLKKAPTKPLKITPVEEPWEELVRQAEEEFPDRVELEDIMTEEEIARAFAEAEAINREFAQKTGILNPTDLAFLTVATALQVCKTLLFPTMAELFGYGESFDPATRKKHDDESIKNAQRTATDKYRDKKLEKHETGHWINLLYQTPPYDITKGSKDLGINMGGAYHRLYTLGHDPILGWLFGTMNILTDTITFNNFSTLRVTRKPMRITPQKVPVGIMVKESIEWVQADFLNLPAAVFAEAQHLKSDAFTKCGLPVPVLAAFNETFANELYRSHYDALCLARDAKITGASLLVSRLFDMLITLVHGLFRREDEDRRVYEVRTRKILLLSNSIASSCSAIRTAVTKNPKNLDIGGILNTVAHLFGDLRFMAKVKREFIEAELSSALQAELNEIDSLLAELSAP